MYVDSSGQEYYPQNPTHPEKTLSVLERYYRKKGVVVFLSVIFLSVILIFWGTYEFMLWRKGGINPAILDRNQLIKMITAAPLLIISISGAFISAWKSWQRANGIRSRRIQFQDEFRNKY
jgi:predicted permease